MSAFSDLHHIEHVGGNMTEHFEGGDLASTEFGNGSQQHVFTHDGTHEIASDNSMGGHDVSVDGRVIERDIPTGHGAHDMYDGDMKFIGTVTQNLHGGHDLLNADHGLVDSAIPLGHDTTTVMHYADPLQHLSEYS